jgi:hypothetical protein
MKCPNCGSELRADSVFCQGCGFYLQGRQAHRKAGSTWIVVLVVLAVVAVAGFAAYALLSRPNQHPSPDSQQQQSDSSLSDSSLSAADSSETPGNNGQTVFSHFGSVGQGGASHSAENPSGDNEPGGTQSNPWQPDGGQEPPQAQDNPSDGNPPAQTQAPGGPDNNVDPPTAPAAAADDGLLGLWSASGTSGTMVDPATGTATGSYYSGEWYLFREDGTFRYVIISSGQIISGGVVQEGRYTVRNGEILLTDIRESWYPDLSLSGQTPSYKDKEAADETRTYEYADGGTTLILDGLDYFYRVAS